MSEIKTVLIPDLHGNATSFKRVLDYYGDSVDGYNLTGDLINRGDDSKGVIELARRVQPQLGRGNHEWNLLGALVDCDEARQNFIQNRLWMSSEEGYRYENNTLVSYGIDRYGSPQEAAARLCDVMDRLGHLAFLEAASFYHETGLYIAIHAGLTDQPWAEQRAHLNNRDLEAGQRIFESEPEPIQIRSHALGAQAEAFTATDKIVITGHAHPPQLATKEERITADGKRIRLASEHWNGSEPLYVWESWTGAVVEFKPED